MTVRDLLKEIKIYDCSKTQKIRIGNNSDGGYVALHEACKSTNCLISFGVEDNVTFELDFVEKYPTTDVFLYDHTVDFLPETHANFKFYRKGVSHEKSKRMLTMTDILKNHDSGVTIKMDIEWDEWKVFESLTKEDMSKIDQILVELHFALIDTDKKFLPNIDPEYKLTPYFCNFYKTIYNKINDDLIAKYKKVLELLNDNFYAFHLHPNNSLKKINYGGYSFPPLLEMSFVRKDLVDKVEITKQVFPVEGLDFPNKPYKKEIQDYYPLIEE